MIKVSGREEESEEEVDRERERERKREIEIKRENGKMRAEEKCFAFVDFCFFRLRFNW